MQSRAINIRETSKARAKTYTALGTDSGALVFYEVKYSESNDTGVTGGGTITITNKQKPSYELPATGAAGTPPYTAAGALIMGIALMLGYLINKRSHLRGGDN